MPVFSRPGPVSRSRSSTYTTSSSGGDTPPLSASDGASISEGSQSSIDLSELNALLSNATHPMTNAAQNRARSRARGHGHRRRISQARASRSSVYETIPEEMSNASPARSFASKMGSSTGQPVFIVDPETASIDTLNPGSSVWDEERGIVALRKYYALRDEAQDTVTESKRQWLDTPFSVFALQCEFTISCACVDPNVSHISILPSQAPSWDASPLGSFCSELWSSALRASASPCPIAYSIAGLPLSPGSSSRSNRK